jgi:hypothetical protein
MRSCFTIMPFGGRFDIYYDDVYKPAIAEAGLRATRVDDLYRSSDIVGDIWRYTQEAYVVLADLTEKRPNVFYELGLAHALRKPAILIAESIEEVPFDLRALRILFRNRDLPDWGSKLRQDIIRALQEVLSMPLQAVLPAFLLLAEGPQAKPISQHDLELLSIKSDLEMIKSEVRTITSTSSTHSNSPVASPVENNNRSPNFVSPTKAISRAEEYAYGKLREGAASADVIAGLERKGISRRKAEEMTRAMKRELGRE